MFMTLGRAFRMSKRSLALVVFGFACLAIPAGADDASRLTGAWRLVSAVSEEVETGKKFEPYGPTPTGYLVYLPEGRMVALGAPFSREPSRTDEDRVQRHKSSFGYSGRYTLDGNKVTHHVDMSVHPESVGIKLVREFALEGNKLIIKTVPRVNRVSGTTAVGTLIWEKDAPH
jgi:hypothetical protein